MYFSHCSSRKLLAEEGTPGLRAQTRTIPNPQTVLDQRPHDMCEVGFSSFSDTGVGHQVAAYGFFFVFFLQSHLSEKKKTHRCGRGRPACCRTGTEPSDPRSSCLRSEARGWCTPCGRTPPLRRTSWSSAARVPTGSSRRPQPPAAKQRGGKRQEKTERSSRSEPGAKDKLSCAAQTTVWACWV